MLLPLFYAAGCLPGHVLLWLILLASWCLAVLLRDRKFDRTRLGNLAGLRQEAGRILMLFSVGVVVISLAVLWLNPTEWLSFPRRRPGLWALVMVLYPLLSAYPQELVWRTFFFHRYQAIFEHPRGMVAASSLAFALMHLTFANSVAVALSLVGGWLFGHTYQRSNSTVAAWWEHSLYGWLVFTVGLGRFFFK